MILKRGVSLVSLSLLFVLGACFDSPEDPNKQLNEEMQLVDAYLENETDYIAAGQGIRLVIHEFGELPPPQSSQTIKANVRGTVFSTGVEFTNGSINSLLSAVEVSGLRNGLSALMGGSRATLYVASDLGYGDEGNGNVPPNSILVFEVELEEVVRTTAQQTQFQADTTAIRKYIEDANIQDAIQHPSGIWYTVDAIGTGDRPAVYDGVTVDYKGLFLSNGATFDSGTFTTGIFGLIDGFKVGLPTMYEGGFATFYIPSGLGYGSTGSGSIPANANLKFEVKLISVTN